MSSVVYDENFFAELRKTALDSPRIVVPIITGMIRPTSVIDIGCGEGVWLSAFKECGISRLCGIDGEYIDRSRFLVDQSCFVPADLSTGSLNITDNYDLAVCLEVAEHLTPKNGDSLVRVLTNVAPIVLFSAAVPGQGGTNHVNEQWPSYWTERFANRRFKRLDPIRPRIRDDQRVSWYYRQNILLYASEEAISGSRTLQEELSKAPSEDLEWVHVTIVRTYRDPRYWWKLGKQGLLRMLKRRIEVCRPFRPV